MPNTHSKEVNLTKRVLTSKGMRYCPVVVSPNGRIKPDLVIIKASTKSILRARITWNGAKVVSGFAYRWAKMRRLR